jgi:HSP20 family protein
LDHPDEPASEARSGPGLSNFFGAQPFGISPFGFMRRMLDDLDRLMGDFGTAGSGRASGRDEPLVATNAVWSPQVELLQRGDELVVRVDLPGLREEDVQIAIVDDTLVIEGERRAEAQAQYGDILRSERLYGRFRREIPVPPDADMAHASAIFVDGVLEVAVKLPKQQRRTHRVEVKHSHDDEGESGGSVH